MSRQRGALHHKRAIPGSCVETRQPGYHANPMATLHITDLEAAINHWRDQPQAVVNGVLSAPLSALAEVYAVMTMRGQTSVDEAALSDVATAAWLAWYATTPDTPCIAICSTSQGDAQCKGCGRSFAEVQHWTAMRAAEKRLVWRRITQEGSAWRFNRYAERAA